MSRETIKGAGSDIEVCGCDCVMLVPCMSLAVQTARPPLSDPLSSCAHTHTLLQPTDTNHQTNQTNSPNPTQQPFCC
jgi:hypothetical protein